MANPNPNHSTRFTPGDPRINRKGRPSRAPLTRALLEMLQQPIGQPLADKESTNLEAIAAQIVQGARTGDRGFVRMLYERIEGKVPDKVIHAEDEEQNAPRRISVPDRKRARPGPVDPGGHEAQGADPGGDAPG